ncbi:MAG TPA: alpha/beta fold hydrolase [Actinomycetota bacterium]|nr:alpha/beta fold hydrolase [Actinomycetota bacterium]
MEPVAFSTQDGVRLEGELRMPDAPPGGSAVLCHAHPRFGGSKDHPILWAIRNDLAGRGVAVLAFNFRGTMGSGGTHGAGRTETKDVTAAIDRIAPETDGPISVVGWSFGANVALRQALDDARVRALALVGFPLEHDLDIPPTPSPSELRAFRRPVLLLSGEHDAYSPPDGVRALASRLPDATVETVSGTDHYLWRHERDAAGVVGSFVERALDAQPID